MKTNEPVDKLDDLREGDVIRFRWKRDNLRADQENEDWNHGLVRSAYIFDELRGRTPEWAEKPAFNGAVRDIDLLLREGQTAGSWCFYDGPDLYGQRFDSLEVQRVGQDSVKGMRVSYSDRVM